MTQTPIVLCVDDEPHVLSALKRLLRKENYDVLTAQSAEEGLALLAQSDVHLIISDQRMPVTTGVEFLQKAHELYPETVRIVLSGYADISLILEAINKGSIYRFLAKPWKDEELKSVVRQCMEKYRIEAVNRELTEVTRQQNDELTRLNANLEQIVEYRTRALKLSQEVLEKLPLPVLGVDDEELIVLTNAALGRMFPRLHHLPLGTACRDVFPEQLSSLVRRCLTDRTALEAVLELFEKSLQVLLEPLTDGEEVRGCILVLRGV